MKKFPSLLKGIVFISLTLLLLSGCKKKTEPATGNQDTEPQPVVSQNIASLPKWLPGDYPRIAVVFGYGYETPELQDPVLAELAEEFGLEKDNGLILPLDFPPEYLNGKRIQTGFLTNALADYDIEAVFLAGSPERTHYALANLQDSGATFPVFSIFPQDDETGTEAGSFFVLDYQALPETDEVTDESLIDDHDAAGFTGNLADILIPLIKTLQSVNLTTAAAFADALTPRLDEYFTGCTLTRFSDPQTGLHAYNHFVLGLQ